MDFFIILYDGQVYCGTKRLLCDHIFIRGIEQGDHINIKNFGLVKITDIDEYTFGNYIIGYKVGDYIEKSDH